MKIGLKNTAYACIWLLIYIIYVSKEYNFLPIHVSIENTKNRPTRFRLTYPSCYYMYLKHAIHRCMALSALVFLYFYNIDPQDSKEVFLCFRPPEQESRTQIALRRATNTLVGKHPSWLDLYPASALNAFIEDYFQGNN